MVAVSERALERVDPAGPSAVIPNGVEPHEWLELAPPPDWFAAKAHPRMLYVGSLEQQLDVGQIADVARAFPDASVTLSVGRLPGAGALRAAATRYGRAELLITCGPESLFLSFFSQSSSRCSYISLTLVIAVPSSIWEHCSEQ